MFDTYCHIPCVKVRERPTASDAPISPNTVGLDALWTVANKRGDMQWLLGDRAAFDELALASGGRLRDLFKLLSLLVLDASSQGVPASAERRRLIINELREAYLAFTNEDASGCSSSRTAGRWTSQRRPTTRPSRCFSTPTCCWPTATAPTGTACTR